jgi:signal transduction histidine kinase
VDRLVDLANALLEIEELRGAGPLPREAAAVDELVGAALRGVPGASYPRVEVEAPATVVEVNRRWTELAVANLVRNGLRHGEGQVRVVADVVGGVLVVTVSDEGPGFPDAFVGQAFDRFSRAEESRSTPGSGLGLSLVQAVARAHGGEASIERGAAGARVRLELPS